MPGEWELKPDKASVLFIYPQAEGLTADGMTSDNLQGDMPFINLAERLVNALDSSEDQQFYQDMITSVLGGASLTSDQKIKVAEAYSNTMGKAKYGYLWETGQNQADYALQNPIFPYPSKKVTPEQIRENLYALATTAEGNGLGKAFAAKPLKDSMELGINNLPSSILEQAGIIMPSRFHLSTIQRFSEIGWFDTPQAFQNTDVVRLNLSDYDKVVVVIGEGEGSGDLNFKFREDSTPVKFQNIQEIRLNKGSQKYKISDILALVSIPLDEAINLDFAEDSEGKLKTTNLWVEVAETGVYKKGTPNEVEITDDGLDSMVKNFHAMNDKIKPPLRQFKAKVKLGHNPTITPTSDGLPSFGWIDDMKKEGSKALAYLSNIPQKLADLIKVSAYRRVSPELRVGKNDKGEQNILITALSLLGADIPEIKTLDDIHALYSPADALNAVNFSEDIVDIVNVEALHFGELDTQVSLDSKAWSLYDAITDFLFTTMQTNYNQKLSSLDKRNKVEFLYAKLSDTIKITVDNDILSHFSEQMEGDQDMSKELFKHLQGLFGEDIEVQKMAFSEVNLATLQTKHTSMFQQGVEAVAKNKELETTLEEQRQVNFSEAVNAKWEELTKAGKAIPANKEKFMAVANTLRDTKVNFSEGSESTEQEALDTLVSLFASNGTHVAMGESTQPGTGTGTPDGVSDARSRGRASVDAIEKRKAQNQK